MTGLYYVTNDGEWGIHWYGAADERDPTKRGKREDFQRRAVGHHVAEDKRRRGSLLKFGKKEL